MGLGHICDKHEEYYAHRAYILTEGRHRTYIIKLYLYYMLEGLSIMIRTTKTILSSV